MRSAMACTSSARPPISVSRQCGCRIAQLGIEVLGERLADAAHEVAHQAAAADLGEGAGQRIG